LRLLGVGMRNRTSEQLVKATELWTQLGILLAVTSGMLLVTTDPASYLYNPAFRFKMACLLAAIVYNYTWRQRVASAPHSALMGGLADGLSIALWLSVVFGGIFYAFI
jgi:hypothetical protein